MALERFAFDPPNGWNDATVFPTYEENEAQVRADYQRLHDQTRNFINNKIMQAVETEIDALTLYVQQAIEGIVVGSLPDNSVTTSKLADGAVTASKLAQDAISPELVSTAIAGLIGVPDGVAGLNEDGIVPDAQLPDYATAKDFTVSVANTGWTSSGSYYTKTISVTGITAADKPICDVLLGSDYSSNQGYLAAWALVQRITTASGSITLYATAVPATSFTVQLRAVRG